MNTIAELKHIEDQHVDDYRASEITGFAVSTLRNWRVQSRGPAYIKCGRSVRYRISDLLAFMEKHRVTPGADNDTEV